jgi:hypothetical protein
MPSVFCCHISLCRLELSEGSGKKGDVEHTGLDLDVLRVDGFVQGFSNFLGERFGGEAVEGLGPVVLAGWIIGDDVRRVIEASFLDLLDLGGGRRRGRRGVVGLEASWGGVESDCRLATKEELGGTHARELDNASSCYRGHDGWRDCWRGWKS